MFGRADDSYGPKKTTKQKIKDVLDKQRQQAEKERLKNAKALLKASKQAQKQKRKDIQIKQQIHREEMRTKLAAAKTERREQQTAATKARYQKIGTKLTPLQGIFGGGKKKTTKKKAKRGKFRW